MPLQATRLAVVLIALAVRLWGFEQNGYDNEYDAPDSAGQIMIAGRPRPASARPAASRGVADLADFSGP